MMPNRFRNWLNSPHILLLLACLIYVGGIWTNLFSTHHQLFNLEPYPDGLFYIQEGLQFAKSGQFSIIRADYVFQPNIPFLYPLLLGMGFLVTSVIHSPVVFFYVINVLLGLGSLVCIYAAARAMAHATHSGKVKTAGVIAASLAAYSSHGYVYWLPSIPMAENATLLLGAITLWGLVSRKENIPSQTWRNILTACAIGGLVLNKYVLAIPASCAAMFHLFTLFRKKQWRQLGITLTVFLGFFLVFVFFEVQTRFNPFSSFIPPQPQADMATVVPVFYSPLYILSNARFYFGALLGQSQPFLWLHYPFTSAGLFLFWLVGSIWLIVKRGYLHSLQWLLLLIAQLPLLFIFYVADSRYIILVIPLLSVGIAEIMSHVEHARFFVVLFCLVLSLQLVAQLPFFKYLATSNWLQRSTAWQYEAVKEFNSVLPAQSYLATALPPLFVDFYSSYQYKLLPLSSHQEFLDKQQYLWGSEIDYENLMNTYRKLLNSGNTVFVTNAYLSSNHEQEADFTALNEQFLVVKVADGCLGTCNLYRLKIK